jgi:sialate O-acetylesterase
MITKRRRLAICAAICFSASAPSAIAKPALHSIFTDHAVLQRDQKIEIWGTAAPSETVIVTIGENSVRTTAGAKGEWRVPLSPMKAGGPYALIVSNDGGASQQLNDIYFGDVFLCSGQSNMEMQVKASMNAETETLRADYPQIRAYIVARASSPAPVSDLPQGGSWKVANPENAGDFSAACYYFARDLQPHVGVPIGLISASWGGSAIESWISMDGLAALGKDAELAMLRTYAKDEKLAQYNFGKSWETWWKGSFPQEAGPWAAKDRSGWAAVPLPMRDWKKWGDSDLAQHNGMLWYSKSFTLTPDQAKSGTILHLGQIDEIDMTWVNGKPLAQSFGWGTSRDYAIPAERLKAGQNEIMINIYSGWDMGGMFGPANAIRLEMKDGQSVALGNGWMFKKTPNGADEPPRAPWLAIGGLTNIGNAMIAPLAPYGLRGALWYQGESNAGDAKAYRSFLTALMGDWREKFKNPELPFLVVQLPNFGQPVTKPVNSGWSDLREAQRLAVLGDKAAGLAVTIDAGENDDIHPPNKQIIGLRLARLARNLVYKQNVTPNGPIIISATRSNRGIVMRFGGIDGRLIARSGTSPIAFETCASDQSSCRFVDTVIEGDTIILRPADADASAVRRVRYCWGDAPVCNLYDAAGLPAGPFDVDIQ